MQGAYLGPAFSEKEIKDDQALSGAKPNFMRTSIIWPILLLVNWQRVKL